MALYTRKQYEHDLQAVDAADACISAAVAGSDYRVRLLPYQDDFVDMTMMFWAKCPITKKKLEEPGRDVKKVARVFLTLINGEQISGFRSKEMTATLERVRRKLKGKLLGTRLILQDNDKKPKCDNPENHIQPCKCRPYNLYKLSQVEEQP